MTTLSPAAKARHKSELLRQAALKLDGQYEREAVYFTLNRQPMVATIVETVVGSGQLAFKRRIQHGTRPHLYIEGYMGWDILAWEFIDQITTTKDIPCLPLL